MDLLALNREKKPKSWLKRMWSVNGKTENCRHSKRKRSGNKEKRLL